MFKTYRVEARLKFPSCYHTGYDFHISAKTKADAIKSARKEAAYAGHTRQDGPLIYKAHEEEVAPAAPEFGSMEAYNAATKAMAARMANTTILVGDSEPSIDGEHTDADGYPYAFDAPEAQQEPAIPRAKNAGRYLAELNDGRLLYLNHANEWQECPNFLTRSAEQAVTEAMIEAGAKAIVELRFEDEGEPISDYDRDLSRAALKAALEGGE